MRRSTPRSVTPMAATSGLGGEGRLQYCFHLQYCSQQEVLRATKAAYVNVGSILRPNIATYTDTPRHRINLKYNLFYFCDFYFKDCN